MTEKLNDFELYEIDGETYSLNEIRGFIESSKKVERQTRFINALKLNLSKTTQERNQLCDKLHEIQNLSMFEFGNRYCSSESLEADGHAFARSLGIGVDNAEDDFIAQGEKHYNDTWNIACGDDF
jgi:hypothetical protein